MFDTKVSRRSQVIATDLEDQLIQKLKKTSSFAIQLDKTTDVSSQAQLILFCRFADIEREKITEYYLFCKPLGVVATANANGSNTFPIFGKLEKCIKEKGLR